MELLIISFGTTPLKEKDKLDMPYILCKFNRNNVWKMGTKSDP
jgi:hypothetical protein